MKNLLFSLVILSFNLVALDQIIQSRVFNKMTKNSDAVVRGKVLDIELGSKQSFIYFKVLEATGVKPEEIQDSLMKVYFPITKKDYEVESEKGLNFVAGEELVVFLKKNKGRYWLYREGLGKYSVQWVGGKKYLVSSLIKRNKDGGEITLASFYKLVISVKNVPMKWWENNEFVNKSFLEKSLMTTDLDQKNENLARGIASVEPSLTRHSSRSPAVSPVENSEKPVSVFWLVLLLAVVGGAARLMWKNG